MFRLFSAARLKLLLLFLLIPLSVSAQIPDYPYPNFVPGAVIASGEVNANFGHISDYALNRTGGTIEGHITVDPNVTIDGVDISDFLGDGRILAGTLGSESAPSFASSGQTGTGFYVPEEGEIAFTLSGDVKLDLYDGLIVFDNQIFNTSGKIPAISSSYFASLDAQDLQIPEASFADGDVIARLGQNETITGAWSLSGQSKVKQTWSSAGTTYTGLALNITNTASDDGSEVLRVGDAFSVSPSGKMVAPALKVTKNAGEGYFLVSNAQGKGQWALSAAASPVPSGMLAFFENSCPTGWTDRSSVYANKFLRGGPSFDSTGGGSDSHTHSIDPPSATSGTESVTHVHSVDIPATDTTTEGDHDHSISGSTGSAGGSHSHTDTTGIPSLTRTAEDGPDVEVASTSHTHTLTTSSVNVNHTHSAGSLNIVAVGDFHKHSVDFAAANTGSETTTHTHSVNIAAFTSGSGSNIPAYVQVVVCKKD